MKKVSFRVSGVAACVSIVLMMAASCLMGLSSGDWSQIFAFAALVFGAVFVYSSSKILNELDRRERAKTA